MVTATYEIVGMTCEHCVRAVRNEVAALAGVSEVRVDLSSGRAVVTSDQPLSHEALRAAVDEAGYQLREGPGR
jgi:copper ion binding protein